MYLAGLHSVAACISLYHYRSYRALISATVFNGAVQQYSCHTQAHARGVAGGGGGWGGELFNLLAICVGAAQVGVFYGILGIVQGIFFLKFDLLHITGYAF